MITGIVGTLGETSHHGFKVGAVAWKVLSLLYNPADLITHSGYFNINPYSIFNCFLQPSLISEIFRFRSFNVVCIFLHTHFAHCLATDCTLED